MAQRRMFSLDIVSSDAFLDMPVSARELYFQLGMRADDDGFANPKQIIRMVGASGDDLKLLIAKKFVIPFESGVIVIKHWLINNLIRADIYHETKHKNEKSTLFLDENNSYTKNAERSKKLKVITPPPYKVNRNAPALRQRTNSVPIAYTEDSIGKVRLGKGMRESARAKKKEKKYDITYVTNIPDEDLEEFTKFYLASKNQIKEKGFDLKNHCKSQGVEYVDYKATLRKWLKKDFGLRPPKQEFKPDLTVPIISPEKMREIRANNNKILQKTILENQQKLL